MATPARKAQLIGDLREQREALYVAVERLPDAETTRPLFERQRERSSVREQLIHLADAEVTYRAWMERARSMNGADVRAEACPVADFGPGDAATRSAAELVATLAIERRETLALIRDLEPPDFLRLVHTSAGALSVDDLVASLARHDRDLASAIARRDGNLLPRFYARARSSGVGRA